MTARFVGTSLVEDKAMRPMSIGMRMTGLSILLAVLSGGCREKLESTVTGTVSFRQEPVPFALMNFHYQGRGPMAYAMTAEDGSYELFTGSKLGLVAGRYRVAIESPSGLELPKKYSAIDTSGLEYEVNEGSNEIDIGLK